MSITHFPRLLLAACLLFASSFASAEAPAQKTQVPGYYRVMLGNFEITALYDGAIDLDEKLLKNIQQARHPAPARPPVPARARRCRPRSTPT
jgi:hypothetical protein